MNQQLKGVIVRADGMWMPMYDIGLEALQKAVDGYIDVVAARDYTIFVNDDGIGRQMPINMGLIRLFGQMLVGDSVITGGVDAEGNTLPITDAMAMKIIEALPVAPESIRGLMKNSVTKQLIITTFGMDK